MDFRRDDPLLGVDDGEAFAGVVSLLWDERDLLDDVAFRLVQQQRILTSGETRWLARADDDLRAAVARVAQLEVLRAIEVETLIQTRRSGHDLTLHDLSELAPQPFSTILGLQRETLRELVGEIEEAATTNCRLLGVGSTDAREALERVDPAVTPRLAAAEASYRAALGTVGSVRQKSLLAFLA
jgi:FlgN protein.